MKNHIPPTLRTGDFEIDRAFRIALGDIYGNIVHYLSGLLDEPAPCLVAGLSYPDPWTRDAAFNTWNGAGVLIPEVMRNTLLSCLTRGDASAGMGEGCNDVEGSRVPSGVLSISGQYWDRIIWTIGAWSYYCQNGDREFLVLALEAVTNSFRYLEENEWDEEFQLFRGGACIADGLGAYADVYSCVETSGIYQWPACNPDKRHPKGAGLPVMALSTNCLYAESYRLAGLMATELGRPSDPHWQVMRERVIAGIQRHLWNEDGCFFRVYTDPWESAGDRQECLGNCFALLFDIATPEQRARVLENQPMMRYGPPAVYPDFPRYAGSGVPIQSSPPNRPDIEAENLILSAFADLRGGFASHGGAVWPLMMGIHGEAALRSGRPDLFAKELRLMAEVFCRAVQSPEIVHPDCGAPGGAVLEARGTRDSIKRGVSCYRQTWSATSYLRMVLQGLFGMEFLPDGLRLRPHLPRGVERMEFHGFAWRDALLDINVSRGSSTEVFLNSKLLPTPVLPVELTGRHKVDIHTVS